MNTVLIVIIAVAIFLAVNRYINDNEFRKIHDTNRERIPPKE